jgi:cytochrome P450
MTAEVDFTSQAFFRDPAAGVERLRALGPVVATRFPIVGKVWITTTYEATARVLKDGETFTLRKEGGGLAGLRWWMPSFVAALANNMLTMDEPDHTRLREIVDEAFRRRAVLDMEPRIRAIADELAGELFADGSPADLVARYARTLPLSVICELLGLPLADRPRFIAWANTVARLAGVTDFLRMIGGLWPMRRYLEERLRLARAHGGEGLIAELVRVEAEGGGISSNEMVSMVFLLLGAGSETTTHLISGSVYELLRNPGLRDWLAADWGRGNLAVEEFLRFVSPVQFSKPRFVRRDIELDGVHLKKGDRVMAMVTRRRSKRRDDSIFSADPTGTSPSGPESISALAISWHASKAYVPCRRCSHAGRDCGSRSSPPRSAGANGPASGRSKNCRSWQVHNRYLASGDESQTADQDFGLPFPRANRSSV